MQPILPPSFALLWGEIYMEVLEKTMLEMPKIFTSREFNLAAIKNGYPAKLMKHKGMHLFIRRYADNKAPYSKLWIKRGANANPRPEPVELKESTPIMYMSDEDMIKHLKSKGYKIMKPVNDWVEI